MMEENLRRAFHACDLHTSREQRLSFKLALAIAAAALCFSANSYSAPQSSAAKTSHSPEASTVGHARQVVLVSEMEGKKVVGAEGVHIGELRDVVLNLSTGDVRYALLELEPSFFNAQKFYAFPVRTLSVSGTKLTVFYKHPSSRLLEKIRSSNGARMRQDSDPEHLPILDQNAKHLPPLGNGISIRCSRLVGRQVRGSDGSTLGTIADIALDLSQSRLLFVVLAPEQTAVGNRTPKLLPANDLIMFEGTRDLSTSVDSEYLRSATNYVSRRWASLDDKERRELLSEKKSATAGRD